MSDFDKEAEREKLREKYAQEEQKREATEQMSELLLQGATMTNAHCSDCGDPIFRYDGTEFCPTCEKRVDRDDGQAERDADARAGENGEAAAEDGSEPADDQPSDDDQSAPRTVEVTDPSDDATVKFGGDAADASAEPRNGDVPAEENGDAPDDAPTPDSAPTPDPASGVNADATEPDSAGVPEQHSGDVPEQHSAGVPEQSPTGRAPAADDVTERRRDVHTVPSAVPPSGTTRSTAADDGGHDDTGVAASDRLTRAQVTLASTVERFAERALETDSPREAREYLETAREAAETLEATKF